MDDDGALTPNDLEQLARSLAMDGSVGQLVALPAAEARQELAGVIRSADG